MPATPVNENIQSAKQVQQAALLIIRAAEQIDVLRKLRDDGLLNFDEFDSAQLASLGLIEPSQLNKLVDQADTLLDIRNTAVRAKGIAG